MILLFAFDSSNVIKPVSLSNSAFFGSTTVIFFKSSFFTNFEISNVYLLFSFKISVSKFCLVSLSFESTVSGNGLNSRFVILFPEQFNFVSTKFSCSS